MSVEGRLVERLHAVLVEEIRLRRPQYLQQPFTVAEIYQDLVPYRSHRDRIGASMNGDYEHALLKLLAGEGDFVVLESEQARKRLRSELESSNPNTGIFRDYAALDVWLNPARIPESRPAPASAPPAEPAPTPAVEAAPVAAQNASRPRVESAPTPPELSWELALAEKPVRTRAEAVSGPKAEARAATAARAEPATSSRRAAKAEVGSSSAPSNCSWCKSELPSRENLRFCPFCGVDVNLVPCPSCGEKLDQGWRFCIACGTSVVREP